MVTPTEAKAIFKTFNKMFDEVEFDEPLPEDFVVHTAEREYRGPEGLRAFLEDHPEHS